MRRVPRLLASLAALTLLYCRAAPPSPARHLVLVTIDTLRPDHLGAYGNRSVETPNIDALARDGARALDASAQVPLTRPSHVSLLSGLYPAEHGIRDNVSPTLREDVPTLAEWLKSDGFATAAFVSSVVLSKQSGLARGFDTFSDHFEVAGGDERPLDSVHRRGDLPTAEAVAWLETKRDSRLFVWLHLYDPHDPYEPPEPYASRYADRPYDGEVAWSDELVGRLDAALSRLGIRDETLLVVTSDHGEGLGEHGEDVHGYFVYESTLAVPLLLRGPGIAPGQQLLATARSVDLAPTVLDLLGVRLKATAHISGRSLASTLRGGPEPPLEATYAESLTPLLHYGWSDLRSLRDGRFKYILAPRPELFDLRDDPSEKKNLIDSSPAQAAALHGALTKRLAAEKVASESAPAAAAVPPEMLEQLGALGYIGAGGAGLTVKTGADPKDKLDDYRAINVLMREGLTRLREKDPKGAAARFQSLLARGIKSFEVHYYLARAFFDQRRPREAALHFEAAIARLPVFGKAYVSLAICYAALGDTSRALATLKKGQVANPKDPQILEAEATLLRDLERPQQAIAAYEAALPLAPRNAQLRVKLAEMYRDARDPDKAIRLLREAIEINPQPAQFWNSLGMVLGANDHRADAEAAFREAVKRDPLNAQYVYNLGLVLVRLDRRDEALAFFRLALELDSGFAPARSRLAELGQRP
ncbi:MAG: sulfatase-like hydrolase/transferase [Vicinamibacteria bacterium]|nr:sulfatase-like hydrolase/transferase [Vicinamibacteria bacterium]